MANETKTVRGVVEAAAQNTPERYGLRIGGDWYDGFGDVPAARGDAVEVQYAENGRYRNVQSVRVVEAAASDERASDITRAVALKAAAQVCAGSETQAKVVLSLAQAFEGWIAAPRSNADKDARASKTMGRDSNG